MFGNHKIPGIKVATGSLGHGIGFASGIGLASKNKRVYPIISEGELYEGSTWEGLLLLGSLKLKNVNIILDVNNNIILGNPKECLDLGDIKKKIKSFDIVVDSCDGHDFKNVYKKINKLTNLNKPTCLIVNTIKGKGFNLMENKANWHYWNQIDQNTYLKELNKLKNRYKN
jgi:transketolase